MSKAKAGAWFFAVIVSIGVLTITTRAYTQQGQPPQSSNAPVQIPESFASVMQRMKAQKSVVMQRQMDLLEARYDLSNRPAAGVTMSRGKPVQGGVRVKLPHIRAAGRAAQLSHSLQPWLRSDAAPRLDQIIPNSSGSVTLVILNSSSSGVPSF